MIKRAKTLLGGIAMIGLGLFFFFIGSLGLKSKIPIERWKATEGRIVSFNMLDESYSGVYGRVRSVFVPHVEYTYSVNFKD